MLQGRSRPSSLKRPDTYPTPASQVAVGNELEDEFSTEQRSKVLRATTLVSAPTAAYDYDGDHCLHDVEMATLRRGHAIDDDES